MIKPNHKGRLAQVVITTVGALIGALFGQIYFVPSVNVRSPTLADVAWELAGVSASVIVGAVLFSWAGKR
jgi:hypothetical protein